MKNGPKIRSDVRGGIWYIWNISNMNFYIIKREFLSFLFVKIFDEFQKRPTLLDSSWRPRNLKDEVIRVIAILNSYWDAWWLPWSDYACKIDVGDGYWKRNVVVWVLGDGLSHQFFGSKLCHQRCRKYHCSRDIEITMLTNLWVDGFDKNHLRCANFEF